MKATQQLKDEHEGIKLMLNIMETICDDLEKGKQLDIIHYEKILEFIKGFIDKCHHGKEEKYFFMELVNKGIHNEGGLIGSLLQEHNQGREYIAMMGKSLESKDLIKFNTVAAKYRDLLRCHIEKENNVLYVMADQLLDEEIQEALFEKFEQHEESVIGHGVHEELHSMIHKWAAEFEV